jgi:hypothetical protein
MNARLMNTAPESLHRQADTYSALCRLLLETSGQYMDLHFGAMKSSLSIARDHLAVGGATEPARAIEGYSASVTRSMEEAKAFVTQASSLSSASQRQLGELLEESWSHSKALFQHATEEQMSLMRNVTSAMTKGLQTA